jgi:hypothetical protein
MPGASASATGRLDGWADLAGRAVWPRGPSIVSGSGGFVRWATFFGNAGGRDPSGGSGMPGPVAGRSLRPSGPPLIRLTLDPRASSGLASRKPPAGAGDPRASARGFLGERARIKCDPYRAELPALRHPCLRWPAPPALRAWASPPGMLDRRGLGSRGRHQRYMHHGSPGGRAIARSGHPWRALQRAKPAGAMDGLVFAPAHPFGPASAYARLAWRASHRPFRAPLACPATGQACRGHGWPGRRYSLNSSSVAWPR